MLINQTNWNDLSPGDAVKIAGKKGKWVFHAHVTNDRTGDEWVNVYGGTANHERARSFAVDRVNRLPKRRARNLPTVTTESEACA